ncbi:hypothetical protein ACH4E8_34835 [Streptomyces sp. NPDC017979]|uniref:hypothetical protein n=1 Tax=Streptomyces sp. NPDC017979 TaxID=3365024 RepID=UPI0037B9C862
MAETTLLSYRSMPPVVETGCATGISGMGLLKGTMDKGAFCPEARSVPPVAFVVNKGTSEAPAKPVAAVAIPAPSRRRLATMTIPL